MVFGTGVFVFKASEFEKSSISDCKHSLQQGRG